MQKKHLIRKAHIYDKNTDQSVNRGSILQHNKGHIWETYSQHHTQWAKTKIFPTKIRNKTRLSTFTTSIQHSIGSPSHSNQTRKRNKRHPDWKGGDETVTVCRWHDSVHGKSYRLHQKTTWPNKWIWQNRWYKDNIQKSKAFLYTNNEISWTEIRKSIPFAIARRKLKCLGMNLTKEAKDLYSEKYITLQKEIKEDTDKWKHVHAHGLEELTSSKWPYYPKWFIDSMQSLLKYPWIFHRDRTNISEIYMES